MRYLIDTNHWSYLQERHGGVLAHFQALPASARVCMSVVSQGELLAGIGLVSSMGRRQELLVLYQQTLERVAEILPITSEVAHQFAQIYAQLRRRGRPIETNDMWIAATAVVYRLVVVTSDTHFRYIDGLQVEDWTRPAAPDRE